MTEGFAKRMSRIVGDENSVSRYLFEKVGHVAFIGLVLRPVFLSEPLWWSMLLAAIIYDVVGKLMYVYDQHTRKLPIEWGREATDIIFDFWTTLIVAIVAAIPELGLLAIPFSVVWALGIVVASNNQWGSPS